MKNAFLFCLLIFTTLSFAQNQSIIKGSITDDNGYIAFANVALMNKDSVIETGIISSENGSFELKETGYGEKFLLISYLGYQKKEIPVNINSPLVNIGEITLLSDNVNLKEINVKASIPVFAIKKGNMVTNVSASSLSSIGTATDVLDKVPGVIIKDGEISVFGKDNLSIYINNRKVYDTEELNNLNSSDIKSIEVIQNPGAKYNTEDQAVIVIHTKDKEDGFSALAAEELRQGEHLGDKENIELNYTHKKLDISGSYYHYFRKGKSVANEDFTIYSDTIWNEYTTCPYTYDFKEKRVKGTINYKINNNHSVGMQYQGTFSEHNISLSSEADVYANGTDYESVISKSDKQEKPLQHLINTYYEGKISKNVEFDFYGDYVNTKSSSEQNTREFDLTDSIKVNTGNSSNYDMYAIKPILSYTLNDNCNVEFGGEFIKTTGNGSYINSYNSSSNSSYQSEEKISAVFITYSKKLVKNWQLIAGLRYEYHYQNYFNKLSNNTEVDNKDHSFYPDLSISHQGNKVNMSLSAGLRANRPCFEQLNGNNVYVNRFLSETGNPSLKQEKIYSANYLFSYSFINANLGYTYIQDPISFTIVENGTTSNTTVNTYKNYDRYQKIQAMVSLKHKFGFYEPQLTCTYYQQFFKADFNGETLNRKTPEKAIQFYNDFTLPGDYILSANFNYNSYSEYYTSTDNENQSVDLRLRKQFFDKKLSVNLYAHDIFNQIDRKNILKVDNYKFIYYAKRETRYVTINITYRINNFKNKYKGKHAASDELDRL